MADGAGAGEGDDQPPVIRDYGWVSGEVLSPPSQLQGPLSVRRKEEGGSLLLVNLPISCARSAAKGLEYSKNRKGKGGCLQILFFVIPSA